ncbi:tetratricopeptide repeat-containing sensor histidine kinase [Ferruginibacter sp.]
METKQDALNALKQNLSDSNRQFTYNFLSSFYFKYYDTKTLDSAFYYLRKAIYLVDSANRNNTDITNESLSLLAQAYLWSNDTATGKKIFRQVIAGYHNSRQRLKEARAWRRMGKDCWYSYGQFDVSEIPAFFDRAAALFEQEKSFDEKAEAMFDKMNYLASINMKAASEEIVQQLIAQANANNFENFSYIYYLLARQNRYSGSLNKALEYALEMIKYIPLSTNKKALSIFYGELAEIYQGLGDAEQSVVWYKKCIDERERLGFSRYILYRTTSMMVVQMIIAKKEKEALLLLQQLAKRKPPLAHAEKGSLAQSFAYCYTALKEYKLAEPKFIEMLNEFNQGETQNEILYIARYDIAKFYADLDQYTKAQSYLENPSYSPVSLPEYKDYYLLRFRIDSANGKLLSAIKYYQLYKGLNDTIFNEAKSRQINELMIKYESEKKDNNIKSLEKESTVQQGKLLQANQTRNWILGVAILLFVITGLLINTARIRRQANKKLQLQQKEIQAQNDSLQHLLKEKDWLVKEIHHRVKNNLHTIIGLLHTQSGYLKSEEALLAINESQHRIQTMSLIHEKLFQSNDLSTIDMPAYIHELVNYLKHSFDTGQRIQFRLDTDDLQFRLSHTLPLGLILNEAITNAIKYAFPSNSNGIISVSLKHITDHQYQLCIADNGKGLPAGLDVEKSGTMGMSLMKGLSEDMHGSFSIKNDHGTVINILFLYDPFIIENRSV